MTQEKQNKLSDLLGRIKSLKSALPEGEIKSLTDSIIGDHISSLTDKVKGDSTIKVLQEITDRLNQFKKDFDLGPVVSELNNLIEDVSKMRDEMTSTFQKNAQEGEVKFKDIQEMIAKGLETISGDSKSFTENSISPVVGSLTKLQKEIASSTQDSKGNVTSLKQVISAIDSRLNELGVNFEKSNKSFNDSVLSVRSDSSKSVKEAIDKLRKEILTRLSNIGGGNANRNIAIGGNTSVLSQFTDINLKAGSNVTITYSPNKTTKYTDITISSSGGGGSVGGTVRSINNVSTSQTMGDTAGTDYVYIASAGINLTLPTAALNTNLYTVKNTSTSSVLVSTTGGETIDTSSNAILSVQYTAIDLISDGTNFNIT